MLSKLPYESTAGAPRKIGPCHFGISRAFVTFMPKSHSSHLLRFENQLQRSLERLSVPGNGILLAVSGGRDSMAMLHGIVPLGDVLRLSPITVAHLNHGLRGDAGKSDAELVQVTCKSLNVPVIISECDAGQLELASRGSMEEAARLARYKFLQSTAEEQGISLIATAHYAADQAETVLHNILRGTGLRGLRGIPERRRLNESVELIRPMLHIADSVIEEFVQHHSIQFATDASNVDTRFTRNRIRHSLLPQLQKDFNAQVPEALIGLAAQTHELLESLDMIAEAMLTEAVLEQTPEHCRLDVSQLRQHPESIVRHALTLLWQQQNWPRRNMSRDHWSRLTAILFGASPTPSMDLPGGVRVELRRNLLAFEYRGNPATYNSRDVE